MTEEEKKKLIRKAQADYKREYRRKHPEKEKEAQDRYWLRKAMEMYGLKEEGAE